MWSLTSQLITACNNNGSALRLPDLLGGHVKPEEKLCILQGKGSSIALSWLSSRTLALFGLLLLNYKLRWWSYSYLGRSSSQRFLICSAQQNLNSTQRQLSARSSQPFKNKKRTISQDRVVRSVSLSWFIFLPCVLCKRIRSKTLACNIAGRGGQALKSNDSSLSLTLFVSRDTWSKTFQHYIFSATWVTRRVLFFFFFS